MARIDEISEQMWIVEDHDLAIMFSNTELQDDCGRLTKITQPNGGKPLEIMYWGAKNTLPQERETLIAQNGTLGELLRTKRDFTIGGGLINYRSRWENGKEIIDYVETPSKIRDMLDEMAIDRYFLRACKNLLQHGNVFSQFVRNKGGQIMSLTAQESRHIRVTNQNSEGLIDNFVWSGHWHKMNARDRVLKVIPAYAKGIKQPKFILHTGDDMVYDDYYYGPTWWGAKRMIQVACMIPEFHLANIHNGYSIRFWIEVPKDYFSDSTSKGMAPTERTAALKKEKAAKAEFKEKIDQFLGGAKNAGKAVFTEYENIRHLGKEIPGIKIHTLDYDMKGDELLKLYTAALQTLTAAQGIHPSLANVDTAGKLSSGSEMRNAHAVFQKTKTPVNRQILLEPLNLLHKEMKWDPTLKWTFRDVEIVTLDENKSGTKSDVLDQADNAQN